MDAEGGRVAGDEAPEPEDRAEMSGRELRGLLSSSVSMELFSASAVDKKWRAYAQEVCTCSLVAFLPCTMRMRLPRQEMEKFARVKSVWQNNRGKLFVTFHEYIESTQARMAVYHNTCHGYLS